MVAMVFKQEERKRSRVPTRAPALPATSRISRLQSGWLVAEGKVIYRQGWRWRNEEQSRISAGLAMLLLIRSESNADPLHGLN